MNTKSKEEKPGSQPMLFRCVEVVSVLGPRDASIVDAEGLEDALNDLHDEAANSKRQIVSLQVHTTPLDGTRVLYTIQAQWIGIETLQDMARRNALAAGMNGQTGPRGVV